MLFAFEQLIINTEDPNEETAQEVNFIDGKDPQDELQQMLENEDDPYLRDQIMQLYNPFYKGMVDAEQYFQNTDDIINEEDLEESVDESRRQSPAAKVTTQKKDP